MQEQNQQSIPTPVYLVATYDREGKANVMTVGWGGVCNSKKLIYELEAIDDKLEALEDKADSIYDDSFDEKASYFVMVEQLLYGNTDDPAKFIRTVDPIAVKSFLQMFIEKIIVYDGKVSKVCFKNLAPLKFTYK